MEFKSKVKNLSQENENKNCMDCNARNPQWASASLGIFICLECASQHRSYGVRISRVKSVNMDEWSEELYNIMKNGGNAKFRVYLKDKEIENNDKREIYNSEHVKQYKISLCGPEKESDAYVAKPNMNYERREERKEKPTGKYDWISDMIVNNAMYLKDKSIEISTTLHTNVVAPAFGVVKEQASSFNDKWLKRDTKKIENVQRSKENNLDQNNNGTEMKEKKVNFSKWD